MIDPDFKRLMQLGAIELELRTLEAGGMPHSEATDLPEFSTLDLAQRAAFLADLGRRLVEHQRERLGVSNG